MSQILLFCFICRTNLMQDRREGIQACGNYMNLCRVSLAIFSVLFKLLLRRGGGGGGVGGGGVLDITI